MMNKEEKGVATGIDAWRLAYQRTKDVDRDEVGSSNELSMKADGSEYSSGLMMPSDRMIRQSAMRFDSERYADSIKRLFRTYQGESERPSRAELEECVLYMANWQSVLLSKDMDGNLAIHHACQSAAPVETIKFLLEKDAENKTTRESNNDGKVPLHIACECTGELPLEVFEALIENDSQSLSPATSMKDKEGCLPLHLACKNGVSVKHIKLLVDNDEKSLLEENNFEELPLHVACQRSDSVKNIEDHSNLVETIKLLISHDDGLESLATKKKGDHLPLHLASESVISDLMQDILHTNISNDKKYVNLDHLCKYCYPEHFKKAVLDKLDSKPLLGWMNNRSCRRLLVFFLMYDLYCSITWIIIFILASSKYLNDEPIWGLSIFLYAIAFSILNREIYHAFRFHETGALTSYLADLWNWIDIVAVSLVVASTTCFLKFESNDDRPDIRFLLVATAIFQLLLLLSNLKNAFLPFATFVGGLIRILFTLIPFVIVGAAILCAFAFIFFVSRDDEEDFSTFGVSVYSLFAVMIGGPDVTDDVLDIVFGIVTIVVMLNVVIAIVSNTWDEATKKASTVFWEYRLTFIQEMSVFRAKAEERVKSVGCLSLFVDCILKGIDKGLLFDEWSKTIEKDPENYSFFLMILYWIAYTIFFFAGLVSCGIFWPRSICRAVFSASVYTTVQGGTTTVATKYVKLSADEVQKAVEKRMNEFEKKVRTSMVTENKKLHNEIHELKDSLQLLILKVDDLSNSGTPANPE